jgi:hypothetical protein
MAGLSSVILSVDFDPVVRQTFLRGCTKLPFLKIFSREFLVIYLSQVADILKGSLENILSSLAGFHGLFAFIIFRSQCVISLFGIT